MLLLDAHALLWWLAADPRLSVIARTAIADPSNEIIVSVASIWELEIKRASGKLRPPEDLLDAIEGEGMSALPITGRDATRAASLPRHHGDPFDRMLVAQAQRIDAAIVTRDEAFDVYGVDILRA